MKRISLLIVFCIATASVYGQQLVYEPVNPAFGGDTFNYNWLLSSAEAQNSFQEADTGREELSEVEQFAENLNNQLLNQLSRSLFDDQFGSDGLQEGTFSFGSLFIEIFPSSEGLVVNILDTSTGDQTQIIIPD